jgi:SAM-dependent methyltransferase
MNLINRLLAEVNSAVLNASAKARAKRAELLRSELRPTADLAVLDLGSSDGRHIHSNFPDWRNVCLADVDTEAASAGAAAYGYAFVPLGDDGRLPFPDGQFDLVFCSSVLEHVTGPKGEVLWEMSGGQFEGTAAGHQARFAGEIRRVGRSYFVQTPYRYFPIDSHTWLPAPIALLPRPMLVRLLRVINRFWIKQTQPDWHLLSRRRMAALFPDARIVTERFCGLPKSLIAIRDSREQHPD